MVLPEVHYWELVEPYGVQTLRTLLKCHDRYTDDYGFAADHSTGEDCGLGEDAGGNGHRRAYSGIGEIG